MYYTMQQAPTDVLAYVWDWGRWLEQNNDRTLDDGDYITEASITADPPAILLSPPLIVLGGRGVRIRVAGGVPGAIYTLTCKITTHGGLTASSRRKLQITEDAR